MARSVVSGFDGFLFSLSPKLVAFVTSIVAHFKISRLAKNIREYPLLEETGTYFECSIMRFFNSTFADISKALLVELGKYSTEARTMHQVSEFSVRHHLSITLVFSLSLKISGLQKPNSVKCPEVWARMLPSASNTDNNQQTNQLAIFWPLN